jgi:hypothetical protein
MPKYNRSGRGGRVDVIEVFSPHRVGPWDILRPLFRGNMLWITLITAGVLAGLLASQHHTAPAITLLAITGALFLASFRALWVLFGLIIRARAEITVLATVGLAYWWLHTIMTSVFANLVLIGVLVVILLVPASRRFLLRRFWCVLDRHRLRSCLRQTKVRTMNMDGQLPLMLWARPTQTGERVWMWIRAGSASDDLEAALTYIAPACYAREARLNEVRKLSTLVSVDIIRRDPLADPQPITSVLARYTAKVTGSAAGEGTDPIQATDIQDITSRSVDDTSTTAQSASGQAKTKKSIPLPRSEKDADVPATKGAEDLSDYIDID